MANINVVTKTQSGAVEATWAGVASGDDCEWLGLAGYNDKTVTIVGTATVFALQGSNDKADAGNAFTLHNIDNADTAITAAGIFTIKENPLWIRPLLTTGSVTVILSCV